MTLEDIHRLLEKTPAGKALPDMIQREWQMLNGLYSLPTATVSSSMGSIFAGTTTFSSPNRVSVNLGNTMVVKAFINMKTGEIRYFLAKSITDLPERNYLL